MSHPRNRADERDLYVRLRVPVDASRHDIVRAYRRMAQSAHPDAHPDDPEAAQRFRQITEAYEVLVDEERRAAYDRARGPTPRHASIRPRDAVVPRHDGGHVWLGVAPPAQAMWSRPEEPPLRAGPVYIDGHSRPPGTEPPLEASDGLMHVIAELLRRWRL